MEFNSPIDWITITPKSFELVELGGMSFAYTYEAISSKELLIIPKEKLHSIKDYYLYIHPGIKGLGGEVLKKGYHVPLRVLNRSP